ncbi:hypothetical protein V2J09_011239 [Rumex salicifolius]
MKMDGSSSIILPLILLPIIFPLTFSHEPPANPTFTYFLKCMEDKIKPTPEPRTIDYMLTAQSAYGFESLLNHTVHNARFLTPGTRKPSLIITPTSPEEVSAAVVCAKEKGDVSLRIRSGGHDYEGISYTSTLPGDFVLLDLISFRQVHVDPFNKTARVEPAVTLGELYYTIWNNSKTLAFPGGLCPTVGVGGHVSGGGYGHLVRKYGLTSDHVYDALIVLADGRVLDRKGMGEELFWAIRGGGAASFGVVLSYCIHLVDVPEFVTVFNVQKFGPGCITDLVWKWQNVMKDADCNLFMRLLLQPYTPMDTNLPTAKVTFVALYLGNSESLVSLMSRVFPELGITQADCKEMNWAESILYWSNRNGEPVVALSERNYTAPKYEKRKSDYILTPIPKEGLDKLWCKIGSLGEPGMVLNSYGGAMKEYAVDASPFPHRDALFLVQYSGNWKEAAESEKNMEAMRELYAFMEPYVSCSPRRAFWNYRDLDIGVSLNGSYEEGKVYGEKYFMGNFERLVRVKTAVDPCGFFRHEQTIPIITASGRGLVLGVERRWRRKLRRHPRLESPARPSPGHYHDVLRVQDGRTRANVTSPQMAGRRRLHRRQTLHETHHLAHEDRRWKHNGSRSLPSSIPWCTRLPSQNHGNGVPKDCTEMSWIESVLYIAGYTTGTHPSVLLYPPNYFKAKSGFVKATIPESGLEGLRDRFMENSDTGAFITMIWNP